MGPDEHLPVSEHHGLIKALGAGLVEPLPAPVALQHPQVPSGDQSSQGQPGPRSQPGIGLSHLSLWQLARRRGEGSELTVTKHEHTEAAPGAGGEQAYALPFHLTVW